MAEELKQLVRKRGVVKGRLTSFEKYLDGVVQKISDCEIETVDRLVLTELEIRAKTLESLSIEFNEIQNKIETLHENIEEQLSERDCFETIHCRLTAIVKDILETRFRADAAVKNVAVKNPMSLSRVALPQIKLPNFDGSYETWVEFRDTFLSLVHKRSDLDDIEKFHYVRAHLQGEAKQVIHSLEFSAENYKIAWDLLCERYDNKRLLVYNHLKSLFGGSTLSQESAVDLRKMLDNLSKHKRALDSLGLPTDHWDVILIFHLAAKLDKKSEREWEEYKLKNSLPTLDEFKLFLKEKADVLEKLELKKVGDIKQNKLKINRSFISTTRLTCVFCKKEHYITNCNEFLNLSTQCRLEQVKNNKLCINCLKPNHFSKDCRSSPCRKCNRKHHTLLHIDDRRSSVNTQNCQPASQNGSVENIKSNSQVEENNTAVSISSCNFTRTNTVLLSTALVQLKGRNGNLENCRVLLDSGSQSNFISSNMCSRLGLQTSKVEISVVGIGQINSNVKERCNVEVHSLINGFKMIASCLVLPKISESVPGFDVNIIDLKIPNHLRLADPSFYKNSVVDMLLGAEVFYNLLCRGQVSLGQNQPTMQKTVFGWVIAGPLSNDSVIKKINCNLCTNGSLKVDLQQQLSKFWEIEECPVGKSFMSPEEKLCENIFVRTTKKEPNGKFVVDIPLKNSPSQLGQSKQTAANRFRALEFKLQKNPTLKRMYVEFMTEYISLGHMSKINELVEPEVVYYLPHHGVVNNNSLTTKLRVVFDASCPTDSGVSFNDIQCVGPTIQDDLLSIILRFRKHKIVVGADIEKMYRMVNINSSQRCLQRILWRSNPDEELETYSLNTVTYGTASAPFLAVRCLKQLAIEHCEVSPEACEAISHDFYVDDFISGADSEERLIQLCSNVSAILKTASFNLRKWSSNSSEVLQHVQGLDSTTQTLQFGDKSNTKLLGLYWSCEFDSLKYNIRSSFSKAITKRSVLSDISQIFDPLGLLSPSIIIAKIILQKLWSLKLSWDESLPSNIHDQWQKYRDQLSKLNQLEIKRHVIIEEARKIELHGFADASKDAYGCCIYIRSINSNKEIKVSLLCSKSKVAPLKSTTIPRLELCACLLLAQVMNKVNLALKLQFDCIFLWSDSTVALSWIKSSPHLLNVFVANRVSQIQTLTDALHWRHVNTKSNPADLASRGLFPEKLVNSSLWWCGPEWLSFDEVSWPESKFKMEVELPELRVERAQSFAVTCNGALIIENFSNLNRLKRVIAYCLRFAKNCRKPEIRLTGPLTSQELHVSMTCLLRLSQRRTFPDEYRILMTKGQISKKSKLLCLNPFIDNSGIIRVGGRLQNSELTFDERHPIVLSAKDHLTKLIFIDEHQRLLHAGPQQMLACIREKYWPIGGRNLAKQTVHQCIRCYRAKPKLISPLMGALPKSRVQPTNPFCITGVDYAGPILIKDKRGRGSRLTKGYICLFICFATKALHLELVSDLTKEGFIAAFRRFVSRRGTPDSVYSDNGLNFVGAHTELKELGQFLNREEKSLLESFHNQGVNWHFIPAHSPHFGGLWEAGVKFTKHHLKRVIANAHLTFEDMLTVLVQIEAVLNSRPLFPMSSDPNDLDVLTPAHFLIGRRLTSLPDPDVKDIPMTRLSRFQYMQQLQQHFWTRWSKEYLQQLQVRGKWKTNQSSLKVGQLVVIKEDNIPTLNWRLGRVTEIHPGNDGIVRVVSVKTKGGVVKRSFAKICPLPLSEE